MSSTDETAFEEHICEWLVKHGGYNRVKYGNAGSDPRDFDPTVGVDTMDLFEFIGATQAKDWTRLVDAGYDGDSTAAQRSFVQRLGSELDKRGTVDVLRHGVMDRNVSIQLAFFKPASGLTPELTERYEANVLNVTRQLRFDPSTSQSIDLGLFVNGIPVATAELKNPLTGQNVENAIEQYGNDRDPKNRTLSRLGMTHFAVDPSSVAMTTHLAGNRTRFLPFNQGHNLGAGNPPNLDGHQTSYLWKRVWSRDSWMDILDRFIHVEKLSKSSRARPDVIFPRFHQWDAVRKMEIDAKTNGAGQSYLIQHSAGSGKSNSIAWLAHRLSALHTDMDEKIFNKVVVITDRLVLDKQLQETIKQFKHPAGLVQSINESSEQLAKALKGEQAQIIITTLQKFPFIFDKIGKLPSRTYAVIVDEAHSSQTGETAKELRRALGNALGDIKSTEELPHDVERDEIFDSEALILEMVAARGRQPNLSFFAFTATPKGRTLELFGTQNSEGKYQPFHLYPMRQAIEEGFIEDVLKSYITYNQYAHLEKAILDDPNYDTAKARAAIARFVTLHPENLAQKAEIIVEHFRAKIASRVGGEAKAMVVCSSRQHAARMREALRKQIADNGYSIGVLVAFSGEVDGLTESKANGFPMSETAEKFETSDWQIMVVAEKFQTGFDQPKLVAMYVDKTLSGLATVQTLSRLNRIHPKKSGTFVLDFTNDSESVRESFAVYHGETIATPTDPNLLFDTRNDLDKFGILDSGEIENAIPLLVGKNNHAQIYAALQPAVDRFRALNKDEQADFRDALSRFVHVYSFLAQIVPFSNPGLERDYLYCKALSTLIRNSDPGHGINLGSEVELAYLRHELTFEGSISLPYEEGEVTTIFSGTGRMLDPDEESLSEIIAQFNERFGTNWTEEDRLVFEAAAGDLINDAELQNQAANNNEEIFREHIFPDRYEKSLLTRLDRNADLIYDYLDNEELKDSVMDIFAARVQKQAIVARQRTCPIVDLLGLDRESQYLEYKSTLRWDIKAEKKGGVPEDAVLKTIAGFANSQYGGTILIGVKDDGKIYGLEKDYATFSKRGERGDHDLWEQHLENLVRDRLGDAVLDLVSWVFHTINREDLVRVSIEASHFPVFERKGGDEIFWNRAQVSTTAVLNPEERDRIIARRWG